LTPERLKLPEKDLYAKVYGFWVTVIDYGFGDLGDLRFGVEEE